MFLRPVFRARNVASYVLGPQRSFPGRLILPSKNKGLENSLLLIPVTRFYGYAVERRRSQLRVSVRLQSSEGDDHRADEIHIKVDGGMEDAIMGREREMDAG